MNSHPEPYRDHSLEAHSYHLVQPWYNIIVPYFVCTSRPRGSPTMAQSPVDPARPLTPLTPFDTDLDTAPFDIHQTSHSPPCSPCSSGHPLSTPSQPFPLPHLLLRPPLNTSTYEFAEDYHYIVSHEPLNTNGRNLLSLFDNVRALWT